jgi:hypothetical protein
MLFLLAGAQDDDNYANVIAKLDLPVPFFSSYARDKHSVLLNIVFLRHFSGILKERKAGIQILNFFFFMSCMHHAPTRDADHHPFSYHYKTLPLSTSLLSETAFLIVPHDHTHICEVSPQITWPAAVVSQHR